jgi:hypothetical protein
MPPSCCRNEPPSRSARSQAAVARPHKVQHEAHIQQFLSGLTTVEWLTLVLHSPTLVWRIYAGLERVGQPIELCCLQDLMEGIGKALNREGFEATEKRNQPSQRAMRAKQFDSITLPAHQHQALIELWQRLLNMRGIDAIILSSAT